MDRSLNPRDVPKVPVAGSAHDYGLRHLVKHLHGAGRIEDIFNLLVSDSRWLDLKCSRLGNEAYAEDVELAIGEFREPLKQGEIVCLAELHAVLHLVLQQVSRYSDLGLSILASIGREAEAAGSARLRRWPGERFDSLMAIVQALREREVAVEPWLDELTINTWHIEDPYRQGKALCGLSDLMARSGHLQRAEALSTAIADPSWQLFSEVVLASHFLEAGVEERVGELLAGVSARIPRVPDVTLRLGIRSALLALGLKLGIVHDVGEVIQVCREEVGMLDPPSSRAPALLMLYKCLVTSGFQREAKALFTEIRSLIGQEGSLGDLLRHEMVSGLAADGELEQTMELLTEIEDPSIRATARASLGRALFAEGLAAAGRVVLESATQEFERMDRSADSDAILSALAPAFVQAGERQRGLALVEEIKKAASKARALLEIASILARNQEQQEAYARLQEAQELISGIDLRIPRSEAIGAIALCWWRCGHESRANRLLSQACDLHVGAPASGTSRREKAAGFLTAAWLRMGREDRARRWIEELPDDREKTAARSALVAVLLPVGRLADAYAIVETENVSLGLGGNEAWIQTVGQVTGSLARAGAYETARAIVARIEEAKRVLLPVYQAALEQLDQSPDEFTDRIDDSLVELHAQITVALCPFDQPESNRHLVEARRLAQGIKTLPIRVRALSRLAAVSTIAGWHHMGESLFGRAEAAASSISVPTAQNAALEEAAQGYLRAGRADAALRATEKIRDRDRQERMRARIASALLKKRDLASAEAILGPMAENRSDVTALPEWTAALFEAGRTTQAFRILRSFHQEDSLLCVASWLAQGGAANANDQDDYREPFAMDLLRKIVRIASWRNARWGEIYEMLGAETTVSGTPRRHHPSPARVE